MSRDLYLSFSTNTLITTDNTSDFTVTEYSYISVPNNGASYGDASYSEYLNFGAGYDVHFSASTGNKIYWGFDLFNMGESTNIYTLTSSQLRSQGQLQTVNCGCALLEVRANANPCNTIAYGEVTNVTPDQDAESYIHQDLTQVTTIDSNGNPVVPTLVIEAINYNYPTQPGSGHTVTATLSLTGQTYGTSGFVPSTTYVDTFTVTHPGWGTLNNSVNSVSYITLPTTGHGFHRGNWQFELSVSTNNTSVGNKTARAYFKNYSCPS